MTVFVCLQCPHGELEELGPVFQYERHAINFCDYKNRNEVLTSRQWYYEKRELQLELSKELLEGRMKCECPDLPLGKFHHWFCPNLKSKSQKGK